MSVTKQSPTRKVTLEVPEHLLDEITSYMETLKLNKKSAPAKPSAEYDEVRKVVSHRITTSGSYEFHLRFRDGSTEWVPDALCQCEWLIREYLGQGTKTAYLVCRVSSKAQSERSTAISLDAQEKALAEALSLEVKDKYQRIKVIKIVGSAYKNIPTSLLAIIEAVRAGDALYVWRVDRLSRNIIKFAATLDDLYQKGVTIYSHQEKLFYDQEKRLDFLQHLLDSQKDSAATSTRVKAAYKYMKERGDEAVGTLPFGFKYEPTFRVDEEGKQRVAKKLVIEDPKEEALISLIIKESKSKTRKEIAKDFNSKGKYKRGKMWTPSMVGGIQKKKAIKPLRKKREARKKAVEKMEVEENSPKTAKAKSTGAICKAPLRK